MSSVIFIAILAIVGSFFSALLEFLVVPQSSSRRYKYSRAPSYTGSSDIKRSPREQRLTKFHRPDNLLSKEEQLFCDVLKKSVGDSAVIFTKVPVANVLAPAEELGWLQRRGAFNKVSDKHFDFVLCAADGSATKLAIELDDAYDASARQRKRAQLLSSACESAGLPLLRVKAARGYSIGNIREQMTAALAGAAETPVS